MKLGRYRIDFYKAMPHKPWKYDFGGWHIRTWGTVQVEWFTK